MKLLYKRKVEGIHTWGIIKNGSYFLSKIPVFEDGSIDCWELHDLSGIKDKIRCGWLVPQVPVGKTLHITTLAMLEIESCEFKFDNSTYYNYLYQTVKKMNKKMEGLYVKTIEKKENFKKRKLATMAFEHPVKYHLWNDYLGTSTCMFQKDARGLYSVISVACFEDHTFELSSKEDEYLTFEQISDMFEKGHLTAEINEPVWIKIGDLGKVYGRLSNQVCSNKEKLGELKELEHKVCKEDTLHELCRKKYITYLMHPSELNRQSLKEVYEQIPEHLRSFLGDMDSKDNDYYRIIYHPENKREV